MPLFVFDERLLGSRVAAPNRVAFMLEALRDLDERLRRMGARLFVRHGDPVREAIAAARECGATQLHVSADWSASPAGGRGGWRAPAAKSGSRSPPTLE